jgi:hypothetical protein
MRIKVMNSDWFTIRLVAVFVAIAILTAIYLMIGVYSRRLRRASQCLQDYAEAFAIGELPPKSQIRYANDLLHSLNSTDGIANQRAWETTCVFLRTMNLFSAVEHGIELDEAFVQRTAKLAPFARAVTKRYNDWTVALTVNSQSRNASDDLIDALQHTKRFNTFLASESVI